MISGRAPGHETWSTTVEMQPEGDKQSVEVPRFKAIRNPTGGKTVVQMLDEAARRIAFMSMDELRERVAEGLQDGADLVLHHNGAIELLRRVWKVVVQFFPAKLSGLLVAAIDE